MIVSALFAAAALVAQAAESPVESVLTAQAQYKRVHQEALNMVLEGEFDRAVRELEAYLDAHPKDAESLYMLAVAHTQRGDLAAALDAVKGAVDAGLALGRFYVGPRNLLAPLVRDAAFQEYAKDLVEPLVHGPLLGQVTATSASVWVRTTDEVNFKLVCMPPGTPRLPAHTAVARTQASRDYTGVVRIDGLTPNTRYIYRLEIEGDGAAWGTFKTFPAAKEPSAFRIAFGGGAGYVPPHEHMWNTIAARKPDALLLLGDNVYIDAPESQEMQQYTYYRRQSRPEWRRLVASTPVYTIWDDHDFGVNDCWYGDAVDEPAFKIPVWRTYTYNWNNPGYGGGESQPGCWYDFYVGDVHFIMLDGRYYRTDPEGENRTMLGAVQKAWLLDTLAKSTGTFIVLATPVPMVPGTKGGSLDTWDGYPEEREEILDFIESNRIGGVVIISADRHRSDHWRFERSVGYPLHEFESSRLTNQHVHNTMEAAVFSYNELQSFGQIDFDTTLEDPGLTYRIINIDGETVYEATLNKSTLTP